MGYIPGHGGGNRCSGVAEAALEPADTQARAKGIVRHAARAVEAEAEGVEDVAWGREEALRRLTPES